jgi:quercetin dioxygenase-like cupin family protein
MTSRARLVSILPLVGAVAVAIAVAADAPPVLQTDMARVAHLVLEPGASTPQHTHVDPHLAVALVDGTLASVATDGTVTPRAMREGVLAYVQAGVTHALRNDGAAPFRAVTVDLLRAQTGARNRCASVLPGPAGDCPKISANSRKAWLAPQMETDQTRVSLLTLPPGQEQVFKGAATPPLVVALAGAEAKALIELHLPGVPVGHGEKPLHDGDAATGLAQSPLTIRNTGTQPARFLVVEFR